jgi:hypothetical protein
LSLGFALAPTVPAALMSFGNPIVFIYAWALALGSTVILGVPIYLVLRNRVRPSLWKIVLIAGVLGAAPMLVMSGTHVLGLLLRNRSSMVVGYMSSSIDDVIFSFVVGMIGGVVFWLCTVWGDPRFSKQVNA